jgi:predicted permease
MSHSTVRLLRRILRLQRPCPGTTLAIVLTMAAAIGASIAVFSVVDPLLLRPLPFPGPGDLAVATASFPRMQIGTLGLSGPEALEFVELTDAFSAVGLVTFDTLTVGTGTDPVRARAARASASMFDALQPVPVAGAVYRADADQPGAPPVAVLGYAFWKRAFGGDTSIVGRNVRMDGIPTLIVGVLPPMPLLNRDIDVWLPLGLTPATAGPRADHRYTVIARQKAGITLAAARANVEAAVARWQTTTGEFHSPTAAFHPLALEPLAEATTGPTARPLIALAGAVVLVLLIGCANVATLLLARAEQRRADVGTQVALGASRRDIHVLYLGEALVLVAGGAMAGVALAAFGIAALKSFGPALVRPDDIMLNGRALAFAVAVTIVAALAVAAAPIAALDTEQAFRWLQAGGRSAIRSQGRGHVQRALVALQLATAIALSTSAVLTVRSLLALTRADPGFRAERVIRAQVSLPAAGYENDSRVFALYGELLGRIRAVPGVRGAAAMSGTPPLRPANDTTFSLDGAAMPIDHRNIPQVEFIQHVTPGYFTTMGIALRSGRVFTEADGETAAPVAIVNETLARRFWPGASPIGRRMRPAGLNSPWFTVVGVVADVRQAGLQAPPGGEFYIAYRQAHLLFDSWVPRSMNVVAATDGDPVAVARSIREILRGLEPAAAVSGVATMDEIVADTIARPRLLGTVLSAFAAIAVLLAAVGVYSLSAAAAAARTAEFGVRVALGATPRAVASQVLRSGVHPVGAGMIAGALGSASAAHYVTAILDTPAGSPTFNIACATVGLGAVALCSMLVPAVRAARIDPLIALRTL